MSFHDQRGVAAGNNRPIGRALQALRDGHVNPVRHLCHPRQAAVNQRRGDVLRAGYCWR
jgi:hypothetical protein